jgi:hypothetical protein
MILPVPSAAFDDLDDLLENIHTESILAQSKGMEQRFRHRNLFFRDRDLERHLEYIIEKLTTEEERKQYNFSIRILKSGEVNAFAAPDGIIYICTGLLGRVTDEAIVAAVIGHELAHIVQGHTEKNLLTLKLKSRIMANNALKYAKKSKRKANTSSLEEWISGNIPEAALRAAVYGYTAEFEREADSIGAARIAAAGYPPFGNYRQAVNAIGMFDKNSANEDAIERAYHNAMFRNVVLYDAITNLAAGNFELLGMQLEMLLSSDSTDVDVLIMRGDMERLMAPRSFYSFGWYEKALEYEPGNVVALRALGFAHYSMGDNGKASEYLRRYSELAKDAADIKMVREVLDKCEK